MTLFDRATRGHIVSEVASAITVDHDRAALVLQEVLDYGPASEHFEVVLPILWGHISKIARQVCTAHQRVEERLVEALREAVDRSEAADQMFADHPDLQQ